MSTDIFDPTIEPSAPDDADFSAPWPPMVRDDPADDTAADGASEEAPDALEDDQPNWGPDTGATTAEYAITTLAACGFAALLVVVLKSEPIRELVTGVIQTALGLGG
ncbi:uncharacterized protein DUF4244 [Brevibacterium sanguinis]|uniref:Uncharacterized protein DUF4244 n=2 Tax=Brevibacterium TaxID=1696 RepID=A0A366IET3_9MICO|nr:MULTISPECIES: DUF4244 domain-containing protein [Brevibacterium]RBP63389.1 uncharacterized protein DUF4244 [Brevibacterium sanguinis]RBP69856.1 uncharacterized protein DUF4244 [Brevibacterium celere]